MIYQQIYIFFPTWSVFILLKNHYLFHNLSSKHFCLFYKILIFSCFLCLWDFFFYSQMLNHTLCSLLYNRHLIFLLFDVIWHFSEKCFSGQCSYFLTCFHERFILQTVITLFYDDHFRDSHTFLPFVLINQDFANQPVSCLRAIHWIIIMS